MLVQAFLPLIVAAAISPLVSAFGISRPGLSGTPLEDILYGYFARAYPLFALGVVYGAARIVVSAAFEAGPRRPWRIVSTPFALAVFLLACLYPTYGGLVVRAGYMTGAMGFLGGRSEMVSAALGGGVTALAFAVILGAARALAILRLRFDRRSLAWSAAAWPASGLGALVALSASRLGFDAGGWPERPLAQAAGWQASAIAIVALLPYALLDWQRNAGRVPDLFTAEVPRTATS